MPTFLDSSGAQQNDDTSFNCPRPSGVVAGTLLIAGHATDWGTLNAMDLSGGAEWTRLVWQDDGNSRPHSVIWWKYAGESEPSNYVATQSGDADTVVMIVAIAEAGVDLATGAPRVAKMTGGSGTNLNTPSVNPIGSADLEVRFGFAFSNVAAAGNFDLSPPATYTLHEQLPAEVYTGGAVASKTLSGTAATGVLPFTGASGADARHGFSVLVTSERQLVVRSVFVPSSARRRAASW